jgi:putative DNA primase/helicase
MGQTKQPSGPFAASAPLRIYTLAELDLMAALAREDRTDLGNLNVLARLTDGNLAYVDEHRRWFLWDGKGWVVDRSGSLIQAEALKVAADWQRREAKAQARADSLPAGSPERLRFEKHAKDCGKWAMRCRGRGRLASMLSMGKQDRRFLVSVDQLDAAWERHGPTDPRTDALRVAIHESFAPRNRGHRLHRVLNPYQQGA